jgi:hypothetical protein
MKKAKFIFMTLFVFVTMGISSLGAQTFVDVQEASIRIHKQCEVLSTSLEVLKKKQPNDYIVAKAKLEYYYSIHDAIMAASDVETGLNATALPGTSSLDADAVFTKQESIAFKNEAIALLSI